MQNLPYPRIPNSPDINKTVTIRLKFRNIATESEMTIHMGMGVDR